jgi:hypothetical protein
MREKLSGTDFDTPEGGIFLEQFKIASGFLSPPFLKGDLGDYQMVINPPCPPLEKGGKPLPKLLG